MRNTPWRAEKSRDEGMMLVEVLVALVIIAIISTGVIYSAVSLIQVSRDSRARHTAANLASEEIDLARDVEDVFSLEDRKRDVTLNGDTFHVTRDTSWVSNPSQDQPCGSSGGNITYKRINVSVSWDGMKNNTSPVTSDTLIEPSNRINDSRKGTILVSVKGVTGRGVSGIPVRIVPSKDDPNGARPIATPVRGTDADGCTFAIQVVPGNYDVSVDKPGYLDIEQHQLSAKNGISVDKGKTSTVEFQYDVPAKYTVQLASNVAVANLFFPKNLRLSFLSTNGVSFREVVSSQISNRAASVGPIALHPSASGYQVLAGTFREPGDDNDKTGTCVSVDPESWPDRVTAEGKLQGTRESERAASSTQSVTIPARMGIVTITGTPASDNYLKAVSSPGPGTDDPGCTLDVSYDFGQAVKGSGISVALPFGSWKLYVGSKAGQNTLLTSANLKMESRGSVSSSGVVTFDPREPEGN